MSENSVNNHVLPERKLSSNDRLKVWLQFPRRLILLLIAYGLAVRLIIWLRDLLPLPTGGNREIDWTRSLTNGRPVADVILEGMPNTLRLIGSAIFIALILVLVFTVFAWYANRLEKKTGASGSFLKWIGKLLVFGAATPPVLALGFYLIYILFKTKGIPPEWIFNIGVDLLDSAKNIFKTFLPATILALFPALVTGQFISKELTIPQEKKDKHFWLQWIFKVLETLLRQTGGFLSAAMVIDIVFIWYGVEGLILTGAKNGDYPVMIGALTSITFLAMAGRLGGELFCWLARLVGKSDSPVQPEPNLQDKKPLTKWRVVELIFLLIPIGLIISGLLVNQEKINLTNISDRLLPPSQEYPWGTDPIGRDVQSRVLHSTLVMLRMAGGAAIITLIPSGLIGGFAGYLDSRKRLWSESIADIILLPVDVLMMIPAVPAAVILHIVFISNESDILARIGIFSIILLPRAIRVVQKLWMVFPTQHRWGTLALSGAGTFLLGTMFAGTWLITALDYIGAYLGFGIRPPNPSFGSLIIDGSRYLNSHPEQLLSAIIVIWICSFALYTSANALAGYIGRKEVMTKLNE